jgi:hypothetical protein
VDSTIARAHQHAAGARRHPGQQQEPPGGLSAEPDDHALGRSRGGLTRWGAFVGDELGRSANADERRRSVRCVRRERPRVDLLVRATSDLTRRE